MINAFITSLQDDKEQLLDILKQDEYTAYEAQKNGSLWSWLEPVFRKIKSWLPHFEVSDSVTDWLTVGLAILLLGIAAFAIYWFVKQIIWQKRVRSEAYLTQGQVSRSYRYYWQQAADLRGAGDWREGVRSVFLSLLFYMEDARLIRVEKWKTNWEYAEELTGTASSLVPLFQDSSLLFERIWYGKEAVTEQQFTWLYEQVARVIGRKGESANDKWAE
ncbi:DUF4129 domain-containing protein [Paenibacillus aceris]|uniref:Protein-glutamine gamma-glutamyltransferase-like C-terminal domain-containing protein n=1 Tax=Paenibacillus aceris TaxID=869555 RepID=A0ABS4I7K6_9BACL|nr:DUF4129 domain-containing protein [Paenibacillus aceris]MBP1966899.1 hypothetical protein [Paenibacillus aceris]NHW38971.1 DUF4129 domain-containing protein [Paenibacillus aceris]